MTAVTYTSDLTDITLFESTTGISNYGGGGGAAGAGVDYAIEGTNAIDKQVNATERGFLFQAGSAFSIGADDHFYIWVCVGTYGLADSRDNRGICVAIGDSASAFVQFHVNGNDTLPLGGMLPYAVRFVNTTLTNFRTLVGSPGTSPDSIGCTANITGTAKFANLAADACRIGTGYDILNGTGADPEGNFAGIAADDVSTREGILVEVGGGYNLQGKLRIGSASTACEFLDSNTNINLVDTRHSLTDFTEILVENASSILTLTNINFNALGTNNPGRIEMITSAATATLNNVGFIDFGVSVFGSGTTATGCRWIAADQVTTGNGTFTGCSFDSSPAATAVLAATPAEAAKVSGCTFTSDGNGNGLEITGTAADLTLTDAVFSGYSLTVDADKAIYVNIASGTVNLTLSGGSGVSADSHVRTAGATVNVIVGAVTVQTTTVDSAGLPIATAKVHLRASDATGPFPYQEAVTISRSTTTATVTHTTHGMSSNDKVYLRGISGDRTVDNTVKQITVTTANAYTYTTDDAGDTTYTGTVFLADGQDETNYDNSPTTEGTFSGGTGHTAGDILSITGGSEIIVDVVSSGVITQFTVDAGDDGGGHSASDTLSQLESTGSGTGFSITLDTDNITASIIKSTFVALNGDTNGSGVISLSRVYSTDQPVEGWARKSSSSPYYKEGSITTTIDSADGLNFTAVMVSDE